MILARFIAVVGLLLAVGASAHAQQFYKWTDANGVVHYSKDPPPEGQSADQIAVKERAQQAAEPAPDSTAGADEATSTAGADEVQAKMDAYDEQVCARARESLAALEAGGLVVLRDSQTGAQRNVTAADREAEIAAAREQVAEFCGAPQDSGE